LQEYFVALTYFFALAIVCIVLYAFTYFLPTPDNKNKAKSTFYFRLILLFTMAAMAAILLRFDYSSVIANTVNNIFVLLISYNLMFAIFTRYDQPIQPRHIGFCISHVIVFSALMIVIDKYLSLGFLRSAIVLFNVFIPFSAAVAKCNQQFKVHRIGDKVLYGAMLISLLVFIIYITCYALFFADKKAAPLILYFFALLSFICILFFGFALSIIYSLVGKLRKELFIDKLTGVKNRHYLNEASDKLLSLAKRTDMPVSIILSDIDKFKDINDTYGHAVGDKVLVKFTETIEKALRVEDTFIRIGGEEFVILLPHIDLTHAQQMAERLRLIISELLISVGEETIQITSSFGVTQVNTANGIDSNINHADIALYEAKRGGRNKVVCYHGS